MIITKKDLKEYIEEDNRWFVQDGFKRRIINCITSVPYRDLKQYLLYLRKFEYHYNNSKGSRYHTYLSFYYEGKKNRLGRVLGIEIGPNCFGKGLSIWHYGSIIVNPNVRVGDYCTLHGGNCIGNNGKDKTVPTIGSNVDIGYGAVIIGNIEIADFTVIGANAVVNKSIISTGGTYVGAPARRI